MDRNYLSRISLRKQIMTDHPEITVQADPSIVPAVNELYTYLSGTYLPLRYPTLFRLAKNCPSSVDHLYNQVTHDSLPLIPPNRPIEALTLLGQNMYDKIFCVTGKVITKNSGVRWPC